MFENIATHDIKYQMPMRSGSLTTAVGGAGSGDAAVTRYVSCARRKVTMASPRFRAAPAARNRAAGNYEGQTI